MRSRLPRKVIANALPRVPIPRSPQIFLIRCRSFKPQRSRRGPPAAKLEQTDRLAQRARRQMHVPKDRLDLQTLTVNVQMRVVSWLRRHGFLNDDSSEPPADPATRSALEARLLGSLGLGELSALPSRHGPADDAHDPLPAPPRSQRRRGHSRGFGVDAGVVVSACDRNGRERHCMPKTLRIRSGTQPGERKSCQ